MTDKISRNSLNGMNMASWTCTRPALVIDRLEQYCLCECSKDPSLHLPSTNQAVRSNVLLSNIIVDASTHSKLLRTASRSTIAYFVLYQEVKKFCRKHMSWIYNKMRNAYSMNFISTQFTYFLIGCLRIAEYGAVLVYNFDFWCFKVMQCHLYYCQEPGNKILFQSLRGTCSCTNYPILRVQSG